MDNKTKLRLGGLALLTTAVLSLIIVLIVDSWPLAILLAVIIVAAAAGGFVWTSRRQQRQFLERLKKFDIDPEKGRINEANLRRMYHSGGQHQKDAITLVCLSQKCSVDEAHAIFKKTSDPSGNEPNGRPTGTRSKNVHIANPDSNRPSEHPTPFQTACFYCHQTHFRFHRIMTRLPTAPLKRRLAALVYELLLTGAVTSIAALAAGIAAIFLNPVSTRLSMLATCLILFYAWWLYFRANWHKKGQTLAMQTWKIGLADKNDTSHPCRNCACALFGPAFLLSSSPCLPTPDCVICSIYRPKAHSAPRSFGSSCHGASPCSIPTASSSMTSWPEQGWWI